MHAPSRLARIMARYAYFHQDPRNTATHMVGVPMITYSILVALAGVPLPVAWLADAARLLVLVVGAMFLALDPLVGVLVLAWVVALYLRAVAAVAAGGALVHFGLFFVLGWVLQLVGHALEGRRPALTENLLQVLVAPLFVTVEALQACGLYRRLGDEVDALVGAMDS